MTKGLAIPLLVAVSLFGAHRAAAQPAAAPADERAQKARTLYQLGMARYQLDEHAEAIQLWEEGFRLRPAPEFLYNIAQAYRLMGKPDKALTFYQRYLEMAPAAADREQIEQLIGELTTAVAAQEQARSRPAPRADLVVTPPPPAPPRRRPGWVWPLVAVGAAVVVSGVVVGAVIGTRGEEPGRLMGVTF